LEPGLHNCVTQSSEVEKLSVAGKLKRIFTSSEKLARDYTLVVGKFDGEKKALWVKIPSKEGKKLTGAALKAMGVTPIQYRGEAKDVNLNRKEYDGVMNRLAQVEGTDRELLGKFKGHLKGGFKEVEKKTLRTRFGAGGRGKYITYRKIVADLENIYDRFDALRGTSPLTVTALKVSLSSSIEKEFENQVVNTDRIQKIIEEMQSSLNAAENPGQATGQQKVSQGVSPEIQLYSQEATEVQGRGELAAASTQREQDLDKRELQLDDNQKSGFENILDGTTDLGKIILTGENISMPGAEKRVTELLGTDVSQQSDTDLAVGIASTKGQRPDMEDAHSIQMIPLTFNGEEIQVPYYVLCDGHGDKGVVSGYVAKELPERLQGFIKEVEEQMSADGSLPPAGDESANKEARDAVLRSAFEIMSQVIDYELRTGAENVPANVVEAAKEGGTTALTALCIDGKLHVSNVGDSRAVLVRDGVPVRLSVDAKPDDPRFRQSIEEKGGSVDDKTGKVTNPQGGDKNIAVAGDLGMALYGEILSAKPATTVIEIEEGDKLVLACDGLWDAAGDEEVAGFIEENSAMSNEDIAKKLLEAAYYSRTGDNISVMLADVGAFAMSKDSGGVGWESARPERTWEEGVVPPDDES